MTKVKKYLQQLENSIIQHGSYVLVSAALEAHEPNLLMLQKDFHSVSSYILFDKRLSYEQTGQTIYIFSQEGGSLSTSYARNHDSNYQLSSLIVQATSVQGARAIINAIDNLYRFLQSW